MQKIIFIGSAPHAFFFIFVSLCRLQLKMEKNWTMIGFESRFSGDGINHSVTCATTTQKFATKIAIYISFF